MEALDKRIFFPQKSITKALMDKDPRSVDNVRVIPKTILFQDMYDGKSSEKELQIINCGTNRALVKVFQPASKLFQVRENKRGIWLAAGLSIKKTIKYTHNSAILISKGYLPVYINGNLIHVPIHVKILVPRVELDTNVIDFGTLTVGSSVGTASIVMTNTGLKKCKFLVDLTGLDIFVEPIRGVIGPKRSTKLNVQLIGLYEGNYSKEFWIKTHPPQPVYINATFFYPKLILVYPEYKNEGFTIMNFGRHYCGSDFSRCLVIQNDSSIPTTFVTKVQDGDQILGYKDAKNTFPDMKNFEIQPFEGRLMPFQYAIIQIKFIARKFKLKRKFKMVMIKILKLPYFEEQQSNNGTGTSLEEYRECDLTPSSLMNVIGEEPSHIISLEKETIFPLNDIEIKKQDRYNEVCIFLYGDLEDMNINFWPDHIHLPNLRVSDNCQRVITVENRSRNLPILLRYQATCFVTCKPNVIKLDALQSFEISVCIKAVNLGNIKTYIIFEVYSSGCSKIGQIFIKLTGNVKTACPKSQSEQNFSQSQDRKTLPSAKKVSSDLEQFSYCKSLQVSSPKKSRDRDYPKPWREQPHCGGFINVQPSNYGIAEKEKEFIKVLMQQFRQLFNKNRLSKLIIAEEDEINNFEEKLDVLRSFCVCFPETEYKLDFSEFIPLAPEALSNVIVTPKNLDMGMVISDLPTKATFTIINRNKFPVQVIGKTLCKFVIPELKNFMFIKPNEQRILNFIVCSVTLGKFCAPVEILINAYHIFKVNIVGKIIPKPLSININEIVLKSANDIEFVPVENKFNQSMEFIWSCSDDNIEILPKSGFVPMNQRIFCFVRMLEPRLSGVWEMVMTSSVESSTTINVTCEKSSVRINFSTTTLKFKNIPLNCKTYRMFIMKNVGDSSVNFKVDNCDYLSGLKVKPMSGLLESKAEVQFQVELQLKNVISFKTSFNVIVMDTYFDIHLEGNSVYPQVFLKPHFIQMKNLIPNSLMRTQFEVRNNSAAPVDVRFENLPEIQIVDHLYRPVNANINLLINETRQFYVEYRPLRAAVHFIILPIIINDILGPPLANNPNTLEPKYYLKPNLDKFVVVQKIPTSLPQLKINCQCGDPVILLSSFQLEFSEMNSHNTFTIENVSEEMQSLYFEFIHKDRFELDTSSIDFASEVTNHSMAIQLVPRQSVEVAISFHAEEPGEFNNDLAIFLKSFSSTCIFNTVKCRGTKSVPKIIPARIKLTIFKCLLKSSVTETFELTLLSHRCSCYLNYEGSDKIKLTFSKTSNQSVRKVTLTYFAQQEEIIDTEIKINCLCGAVCTVEVKGVVDNCILTTCFYRKDEVMDKDKIEDQVVKTLERWLFTQIFQGKIYQRIPDTIGMISKNNPADSISSTSSRVTFQLPLVKILTFLAGSKIREYCQMSMEDTFDNIIQQTLNSYTVYRGILVFLNAKKLFLPHIKPEYLLCYLEYKCFKESIYDKDNADSEMLPEKDFLSISKRSWIDVLLQSLQHFLLPRIVQQFNTLKTPQMQAFREYFNANSSKITSRNNVEIILLLWAEYLFNNQKVNLWGNKTVPARKIRSFSKDFQDSLVLACILNAFCPYITPELRTVLPDINETTLIHNACVITQCWKLLNFSFFLKPQQIYDPNHIDMLLMLVYLFLILPNYLPHQNLDIRAPLSGDGYYEILLANPGEAAISYKGIFFGNNDKVFHMPDDTVLIQPKKERKIRVNFIARKLQKATVILLLSGEQFSEHFGKTLVFKVNGVPVAQSKSKETRDLKISFPVSKTIQTIFQLKTPYGVAHSAEIYIGTKPNSTSMDDFVAYSEVASSALLPFKIANSMVTFPVKDPMKLKMYFSCCTAVNKVYYVLFVNNEIGCFTTALRLEAYAQKKNFDNIEVNINSSTLMEGNCMCKNKQSFSMKCPRTVILNVPNRNQLFIAGLKDMIANCMSEEFRSYIFKYLGSSAGVRAVALYVSNSSYKYFYDMSNTIRENVTYSVNSSNNELFDVITKVTVENVCDNGFMEIPIHVNVNSLDSFSNEYIKLESDRGEEIRLYRIVVYTNNKYNNK